MVFHTVLFRVLFYNFDEQLKTLLIAVLNVFFRTR